VVAAAARSALLASLAAGVLWGLTSAAVQRDAWRRWLRPIAAGALAIGLMVMVGVGASVSGTLARTLDEQYTAFVRLGVEPQGSAVPSASSRLVSGAGNRYDYWRVAWSVWEDHPLGGVGAGNYDRPYFERRSTTEDIRQPHSVELQALSELGLPGASLLLAFMTAVGWGAWRLAAAARSSASSRFLAVSATGIVTAWLVHTSVDWIHLLPGVTAIALAGCAVLVRARQPALPSAAPVRPARARLLPAVAVAVVLTVAGVSLSRQGLADYFRGQGQESLAAEPAAALENADRALRLDPEAIGSYYLKAAAQARFNEAAASRGTLLEAAQREPREFVTWALLGDLAVRTGSERLAQTYYRRASALNPRDAGLRALARDPASARNRARP